MTADLADRKDRSPPIDTLGDFHYMCMKSRRLRGASAEASYEVGRDAAPACVARNHVPGRPPGSRDGVLPAPRRSGRRRTQIAENAAVVRREARALLARAPGPGDPGSPEHKSGRPGVIQGMRLFGAPSPSSGGRREKGIRANPRARQKTGASDVLPSRWTGVDARDVLSVRPRGSGGPETKRSDLERTGSPLARG